MRTFDLSLLLRLFKVARFGSLQITSNSYSVISVYFNGSGSGVQGYRAQLDSTSERR